MGRDSVFDKFLQPSQFAKDRAIIPRKTVAKTMTVIERRAVDAMFGMLRNGILEIVEQAEEAITNQNSFAVATLDWDFGVALQTPIFQLWDEAWFAGSEHGIEAMQKSVPPTLRRAVDETFSSFNEQDPTQLNLIRQIFQLGANGLRNNAAEQAVLRRTINLAGDFSADTITRLRGDLIAAIQPQPDTGVPISRAALQERIQTTLNVTKTRAEAIARTEITSAYANGRLESFGRSELVEGFRLLAIRDNRTTQICRDRNGMVILMNDPAVSEYTPPFHVRCRTTPSPLLPRINKSHQQMFDDPARRPENRTLTPLPPGWNGATSTAQKRASSLQDTVLDFSVKSETQNLATRKITIPEFKTKNYKMEDFVAYKDAKVLVSANSNAAAIKPTKSAVGDALREGIVPNDSVLAQVKLTKKQAVQLEANREKLKKAENTIQKSEEILRKKSVPSPQKWKPQMTREEANKYFGEDNYFGEQSFWHGNSSSVTQSMKAEGAIPDRNTRGAYGKGVYAGSSKGTGLTYGNPYEGDTELLEMRIYSKNPYIVSGGDMKRLTEDGLLLEGYDNDVRVLLKNRGYDSIYVKDEGYVVAFDKEQITIVDSAKPPKAGASLEDYAAFERTQISKFQKDMLKAKASPDNFGAEISEIFDDDFF